MQTRDIVTSSATILGLIITAFGILVTLAGESEQTIVKNFSLIFVVVVALFVCSVIFTTFSSLLRKSKLWSCALVFYVFGWGFLGTVMILTLVGYGYGIDMLQLQLPQFNVALVNVLSMIVGLVASISSSILFYMRSSEYRKRVSERSRLLEVTTEELTDARTKLKRASLDLNDQIVILRADLERQIRKLARLSGIAKKIERRHFRLTGLIYALMEENILSSHLANTTLFVYRECSKAVHGEFLSDKDAHAIRELGLKILVTLREVVEKCSKK